MEIEQSPDGWLVRIPDAVIDTLALRDGDAVTIRPIIKKGEEIRHAIREMRGNLPDYPFDYEQAERI